MKWYDEFIEKQITKFGINFRELYRDLCIVSMPSGHNDGESMNSVKLMVEELDEHCSLMSDTDKAHLIECLIIERYFK